MPPPIFSKLLGIKDSGLEKYLSSNLPTEIKCLKTAENMAKSLKVQPVEANVLVFYMEWLLV